MDRFRDLGACVFSESAAWVGLGLTRRGVGFREGGSLEWPSREVRADLLCGA